MRQEQQPTENGTMDVLASMPHESGMPANRSRQHSSRLTPTHPASPRSGGADIVALAHTLVAQLPPESALPRALAICGRLLPGVSLRLFAVRDSANDRLTLVGEVPRTDDPHAADGVVAHDAVRDVTTLGFGEEVDRATLRERKVCRVGGGQTLPLEAASGTLVGALVVIEASDDQYDPALLTLCADSLAVLLDRLRQEHLSARVGHALAAMPSLSAPDDDETAEAICRRAQAAITALVQPNAVLLLVPGDDGALRMMSRDRSPEALDAPHSAEILAALRAERNVTFSAEENRDLWTTLATLRQQLAQGDDDELARLTLLPVTDDGAIVAVLALAHAADGDDIAGWLPAARALAAAAAAGIRTLRLRGAVAAEGKARDEYISLAGHELRSPLTSIKGYSQLLARQSRKTALPDSMLRSVEAIEQQSMRMAEMVGELLDASRIQRGRLDINLTRVEIVPIALKVVERRRMFHPQHTIELNIGADVLTGNWDALRVEQIMRDLLDNAARFSPEGGPITIRLERDGSNGVVRVRDRGIGVAEDDRDRIFEYLYRAPDAQERNLSGLGLGLYICRHLAERMGGSLALRETPTGEESGSEFVLTLPLA